MTLSKLLFRVTVISAFLFVGCQKDIGKNEQRSSSQSSSSMSEATKKKLTAIKASLPKDYADRIKLNAPILIQTHPEYREIVTRILNDVKATQCNPNTDLSVWLDDQLSDWNSDVIFYALITGMLDFPTYDALLFENSSANQYFGLDREYTQTLTKTFKDLKRFWNIESQSMVMVAMHGNMLLDRDRVIRIDMVLYGDNESKAENWADLILQLLDIFPQYRNGDHPIFTFNSFAQPGFNFPPYGMIPDKIVIGDGVLEGYSAIGYGDVASQAVLAHEYGHQVQFQLGLFSNGSPASTRKMELMADAFSAYYLSHARGASMQWKRVQQFLSVFFNIGDCQFSSSGHHGTPLQRMAAAEWAYHLADDAQKQGHILTAQEFVSLFNKALPSILAQ
jgi:hypothetical protein